MKFKRIFCFAVCCFSLLSINVFAQAQDVSINDGDNKISIEMPENYGYITKNDVEKDATYFKDFPIDKNEAIKLINEDGVIIDGFSDESDGEIRASITTDNFSQTIANFTPMDNTDKQSVIKSIRSIRENEGDAFLSDPEVVEYDGYDFVQYDCRVGSGSDGYSYVTAVTIIGKKWYEFTCYSTMSVPDEATLKASDDVFKSISLDIKGEHAQIVTNVFQQIIGYIIIIVAALAIIYAIYSLIKFFIAYRNREEKVKLRKRQ